MGAVRLESFRQGAVVALETEDLLDLVPDGQHEEESESHEDREREDEAQPRLGLLPPAPRARVAARTVVVVGAVDRSRVDGRRFGGSHRAAGWLSHPLESSAPSGDTAGRSRSLGRYLGRVG